MSSLLPRFQPLMPVQFSSMQLALAKLPQKGSENPNTNHPKLLLLKCFLLRCPQKISLLRLSTHQDYASDALCHHVPAANCSFVPGSKIATWNNVFAQAGLNC